MGDETDFVYESLPERIYKHLKRNIINGVYEPGERLQETDLAEKLNVSRTPVREAFNRLGAEGLVTITPRRGVFVTDLTPKNINDLYELREALEILAVRLALPKMTDGNLETMHKLVEKAKSLNTKEDSKYFFELDKEFHDTLIELTGNTYLIDTNRRLGSGIHLTRMMRCDEFSMHEKTLQEHEGILEALSNNDIERSAELLGNHISNVRKELSGQD